MHLFHKIDDAECIVRTKGGVFRQTDLYRRGDRVFAKVSGGFVRICAQFGESWGTSSPGISIVGMPTGINGLEVKANKEPRWVARTNA